MNVIISGCTCSGKTTLANKIYEELFNSMKISHIEQDWYFKDLDDMPKSRLGYLMESPNAFHTDEFIDDITKLMRNKYVLMPQYEMRTNTRKKKQRKIEFGNINVIEGLHTIDLLDTLEDSIKVFIDTDMNECLKRRIERDKKYRFTEDKVRYNFNNTILPLYKEYIEPQKELSDFIIERRSDEECLLLKLKKF